MCYLAYVRSRVSQSVAAAERSVPGDQACLDADVSSCVLISLEDQLDLSYCFRLCWSVVPSQDACGVCCTRTRMHRILDDQLAVVAKCIVTECWFAVGLHLHVVYGLWNLGDACLRLCQFLQGSVIFDVLERYRGIEPRETASQEIGMNNFNDVHVLSLPCTDAEDVGTALADGIVLPVVQDVARVLEHRVSVTG